MASKRQGDASRREGAAAEEAFRQYALRHDLKPRRGTAADDYLGHTDFFVELRGETVSVDVKNWKVRLRLCRSVVVHTAQRSVTS